VDTAPPAGFLVHRLGPGHVAFKTQFVGHLSVVVTMGPIHRIIAMCSCEQSAHAQQPDFAQYEGRDQ
jgi:hypothetical protein